jgi:hypothetical protein
MVIAVGFGGAHVLEDGLVILDGESPTGRTRLARDSRRAVGPDGYLRVCDVDRFIRRERKRGRRFGRLEIQMFAPLWSATWERRHVRGQQRWICTEAGEGFA